MYTGYMFIKCPAVNINVQWLYVYQVSCCKYKCTLVICLSSVTLKYRKELNRPALSIIKPLKVEAK